MATYDKKVNISRESKAVVYPAATVAGYGHIFSLGLAGIHVVALSHAQCENFKSRYVKERYIVPNPIQDHQQFVDWLVRYGRKQAHRPVLFLAEDLYAYIASLYQDELGELYCYPYIDLQKINVFFNKRNMHQAAIDAGLNIPRSAVSPLHDKDILDWNEYPVVVKPLVSRFTFDGKILRDAVKFPKFFGGKAIQANNKTELLRAVHKLEKERIEFCIQQLISGENKCIANVKFVSSRNFDIPACFISRKIRQQPADFGTCSVSQAEYIQELHSQTTKFCKFTQYTGPGGVEFKWNQGDRKWYFIEINPRLDFWIGMSTLKGTNLPLQQYLLSTEQDLLCQRQVDGGRYWIDIPGDIQGYKWRKAHKEWAISITEFLKPYLYFNEAVWNIKDPLPGILKFYHLIRPLLPRTGLRKYYRYVFGQTKIS